MSYEKHQKGVLILTLKYIKKNINNYTYLGSVI